MELATSFPYFRAIDLAAANLIFASLSLMPSLAKWPEKADFFRKPLPAKPIFTIWSNPSTGFLEDKKTDLAATNGLVFSISMIADFCFRGSRPWLSEITPILEISLIAKNRCLKSGKPKEHAAKPWGNLANLREILVLTPKAPESPRNRPPKSGP